MEYMIEKFINVINAYRILELKLEKIEYGYKLTITKSPVKLDSRLVGLKINNEPMFEPLKDKDKNLYLVTYLYKEDYAEKLIKIDTTIRSCIK